MVEGKSKPLVLVIEDDPVFLGNAVAALKECEVVPVMDLEQAKRALKDMEFDYILSDVHYPESKGKEPEPHVKAILEAAYAKGITVCFVTKADHHGLLDLGDEGFISLRAASFGDIASTFMELSKTGESVSEGEMFRKMKASLSENVKTGSKTPDLWRKALDMAMNAATKIHPIGAAIKKVRGIGLDVSMRLGMPRVGPLKK
jgi:CheY-like chemotaxis protein